MIGRRGFIGSVVGALAGLLSLGDYLPKKAPPHEYESGYLTMPSPGVSLEEHVYNTNRWDDNLRRQKLQIISANPEPKQFKDGTRYYQVVMKRVPGLPRKAPETDRRT